MNPTTLNRVALPLALLAGCGLLAFGLWQHDVLAQMAPARTRDALQYAAGATLLAWVLKRVLRLDFGRALATTILVAHVVMVGFAPVLATLVLALSALAVGTLVLPARSTRHALLALLIGLGLIAGSIGWLLPHEIHYFAVYASAAFLIIAWRRRALGMALGEVVRSWSGSWALSWEGWLGLIVLGYSATAAWLPTVQFDDLATHLGMPWQLAGNGYYRFDVSSQVWAVAPWSGDALYAVVQVLGGVDARGALDSLWLLGAAALIWQILAALAIESRWRWLAVALFASQPLTHTLMQSMQTELATAAVLLAIAGLLLDADPAIAARTRTLAFAALVGFALGLKVSTLVFLGPLGLWFLWRVRPPLPWRALPQALLLAFVAGGSSYLYAAILTGNPVLPLFNDVFAAPDYPAERFADPTYLGLISWTAPFDMVVNTHRYLASWDGAGGFQWLALFGVLLLAARVAAARALLLVGLAGLVLMYMQIQYLRYLFPALALLSVPLVQGLADDDRALWRRLLVLVLVALNVAAMSSAMWTLREPPLSLWRKGGVSTADNYLRTIAPERLLLQYLRHAYGQNYSILFLGTDAPYAAEAAGHGFMDSWYDPWLSRHAQAASSDESGAAYVQLFDAAGATHVTLHPHKAPLALLAALAQRGVLERREGDAALYRIERPPAKVTGMPASGGSLAPQHLLVLVTPEVAGPVVVEVDTAVRCAPYDAAVLVRIEGMTRKGVRQIGLDYQRCGHNGLLRLQAYGSARSAEGLRLWIEPGGAPAPANYVVESLQVHVRHDLTTQRDRHRELRP